MPFYERAGAALDPLDPYDGFGRGGSKEPPPGSSEIIAHRSCREGKLRDEKFAHHHTFMMGSNRSS